MSKSIANPSRGAACAEQGREVHVLETCLDRCEAFPRILVGENVQDCLAREESRRKDLVPLAILRQRAALYRFHPDPSARGVNQIERRALELHTPVYEHRHPRTEVRHVLYYMSGKDHDHVLADLGQKIQESIPLLRIQTSS